ncbi:hypothetical protein [Piscinibacter koreensis]|uniref:Uncharacterized protein n=1 Tax=Piscinibacter koreensis TaxID=2742824 RepID=A0A7Y6TUZ3_9BURK|nr:hypothetical protein [Schlegelella koreensis]NUZ04549.1 hypothetical protein [Schlegelella koreensis]
MKLKSSIAAIGLMLAGVAFAQPSIYYLWKNNATGKTMCNPDAPAAGWVKVGGPFEDSNCTIKAPQ